MVAEVTKIYGKSFLDDPDVINAQRKANKEFSDRVDEIVRKDFMTKIYKLLRDTPLNKAGTIFIQGPECSPTYWAEQHPVPDPPPLLPFREHENYGPIAVEDNPDWFEEIKDEPEFKIMSPAVGLQTSNGQNCPSGIYITDELFSDESEARKWLLGAFYSWPACDKDGNPIQYRVPIK
jgi:hypothetical protein